MTDSATPVKPARKPRKDFVARRTIERDTEALARATRQDYEALADLLDGYPGSLMPLGAALARKQVAVLRAEELEDEKDAKEWGADAASRT